MTKKAKDKPKAKDEIKPYQLLWNAQVLLAEALKENEDEVVDAFLKGADEAIEKALVLM